jgi:hypothetical protein
MLFCGTGLREGLHDGLEVQSVPFGFFVKLNPSGSDVVEG